MSKIFQLGDTVKPIVVLSVISLVVSLLLALVNAMTAPVIAENTKRTTLAAYVGVLPSVSDASELEEVTGYTTAEHHRRGQGSGRQPGHQGRGEGL